MLLVSAYFIILFHLIIVSIFFLCVFFSLCVAFVVLALVFLPGLYSAAYRAAFLAQPAEERTTVCGCLLFVSFVCISCSFSPYFCSFLFVLRSCSRFDLVYSSVYLVTTAGFVADQLLM